jgi:hypothetical protein
MLRVLVDATALPENHAGVGRCVDEVLARMPGLASMRTSSLSPGPGPPRRGSPRRSVHLVPGGPSGPRSGWGCEQSALPLLVRSLRPNVVHSPHRASGGVRAGTSHDGRGDLGPRIHAADGMLCPSPRDLPSLGRGIGHEAFGWVWPSNPWTASNRRERGTPGPHRRHERGDRGWAQP